MEDLILYPLKEANRITKMLDLVFGQDRFDRQPVDVEALALEYSKTIDPKSPIQSVQSLDLRGCLGALIYTDDQPRQWGIAYQKGQSPGRRSFTLGHEFGHYILHRHLIETDPRFEGGLYCDEESILRRGGEGIEKEADIFAAALLMPFHDFRNQIAADVRVDFAKLSLAAKRYGVSLTAAILRWLEYTTTRAIMVVSTDGYALWGWSSDAAFKSGRFVRTKHSPFELPNSALAIKREFTEEAKTGILQPIGGWNFPEPVVEMCIRSDRYDQEITLLHFEGAGPVFQAEEIEEDIFDRFINNGQPTSLPGRMCR